ncbi:MAG: c-type cytochrome [Omnitrophica WOR_2 bacterium]|jgi:mono/diheme cytochrome c family protein
MKSIFSMLSILTVLFFLSYCTSKKENRESNDQTKVQTTEMSQADLVKKGEYLVTIGGCNDCHSPKKITEKGAEVIKETMLSGYPANRPILQPDKAALKKGFALMAMDMTQAVGPWGVSFAANLTPDPTGIGNWTEEQFMKALRQGKFKGMDNGRALLPPMPWYNYAKMTDDDIKAVFAYLKSIKPVSNVVPPPMAPNEIK